MAKYRVVNAFTDGTDGHTYGKGDPFPHANVEVDPARLEALQGYFKLLQGPAIEEVAPEMTVKDMRKALDDKGIEYDKKARKAELEALLKGEEVSPEEV